VPFPKYGVLTTARMIEDMVIILKAHGVHHITLIEGILNMDNSNDALLKYGDIDINEASKFHKHTILLGQCQVMLNRKNPKIKNCVQIRGCPPEKAAFIDAFEQLGIKLPDNPIEWMKNLPSSFTTQYINKPEFEEDFYQSAAIS
jgi:hypothetical protein